MEKQIMSGNEALARGAWEAGCAVAAAYPGTPSTEVLENLAQYGQDLYCQWACNEKVAAEIASGASIGGARSLCAMKHVGMNVAADPLFTMGYAGVNGGMVVVCADDPGCHSSQNEQDNRLYAPHAKLAMMEPSDSAECRGFMKAAFALSERFDVPLMMRVTTRVCHSKGLVELAPREEVPVRKYERRPEKYAMLPGTARRRHVIREELMAEMEKYSNDCPFNRVEWAADRKVGIVTSGISYQHAREVFGDSASYLKLGLTNPLPRKLMAGFASQVERLIVVEENEPYLETALRALGFTHCEGKDKVTCQGELNAQILREALLGGPAAEVYSVEADVPPRPPVLCAGCPHRGFFYAVNGALDKIVPAGDIGCYALGAAAPLNGFDYSICMGSGLSSIIGLAKALERQGDRRKALGMVGDSTFFHSGLNSLIDVVSAEANVIACVLDNSITAMTGHQDNPGTAANLMGQAKKPIDLVSLIRATELEERRLRVVDPLDLEAMKSALQAAVEIEGPFVIVTRRPCALIKEVAKANAGKFCRVDAEKCRGCRACMKIACPALSFEDGRARIADPGSCTGCGLCKSLCRFNAIEKVGD